ncbi:serine protease [Streptomyces sp. CoT10]|uniref:S1 family peptidase n=1 Tax=Streptomyces sp. CoT10 TaxID=2875762 RepID=UPI001CD6AB35|nr:serine protease [Streptomyces sp. CoT10]
MVKPHLDVARVARLVADLPDGRCRLGSGYRVSNQLVVTAAHVLKDITGVAARLGGDGIDRPVTCVWRDEALDLALLRFDTPPATPVEPVRLGSVDRARHTDVSAHALGYPGWAEVDRSSPQAPDDVWRGRAGVRCRILTSDTGAPDRLRVVVEDAAPAPAPPGESPWQGMSGAALITEDSGLLIAVVNDHVPAAGVGRLEVTPLDRVDDEEWRALLRTEDVDPRPLPALPDGWDRTGRQDRNNALRQHHVRLDVIRRSYRPLVQEKLPYVDPGGAGSPGAVLARLANLASRPGLPAGLVVVGEPGAGKTRLCLETAALAEDSRDWLVVHLTKAASLIDVWDSVQELADQVLVVADDIDWIAEPGTTYNEVFSEAAGSGVRLAVLTTARRVRLNDLADGPLNPMRTFETVDVRWDRQYHRAISRQMVRSLARDAVRQRGERHLERLCAGPPAASQLCATYYDNQAREGHDLTDAVPRPDDEFSNWLRDILLGMRLPAVPGDGAPDPVTTAVAQIVVHSPCRFEDALDFFAPSCDDPRRDAGGLMIGRLVDNGLLYAEDDALRPEHDVYADSLLGHAVLKADQKTVHRDGLRRVLETGLGDGPALVRVATAVDRLRETLDAEVGGKLARVVEEWCANRLDALRNLVLTDPEGEGREIRTLLIRRTWRPVAVRELAEPWLREHYTKARARDAVLTAARHLPPRISRRYLTEWIYGHADRPEAALALHQALEADDLDPATREWTAEQAYEWLTRHSHRINACRPLQRLLDFRKNALPHGDPRIGQVLYWALRWLRRYGTMREAGFVARPLLQRRELTGTDLAWVARLLLDTVAPGDPPNATFALEAVLTRHRLYRDLPEGMFEQAVKASFTWLDHDAGYGLRPVAAYLLKQLVVPGLPGRDALPHAVQAAWNWLEPNADQHVELGLVLPPLLKNAAKSTARDNAAFTDDEQRQLGRLAMNWLAARGSSTGPSVSEVTGALLDTELPDEDPEWLHWLADRALTLLQERPDPTVARSVLTPLLRRTHLDRDIRDRLLKATFAQLTSAPASPHMAYPLTSLLRRSDLTGDEPARAMAATLQCLDRCPKAPGAPGLLTTALNSRLATPTDRARLAARAVQVLSVRTLVQEKGYKKKPSLVRALRTRRTETSAEWNRFVARACDLLERAGQPKRAEPALEDMLKGTDQLDAPILEQLYTTCVDWSTVNDHDNRAINLLAAVLDSRAPSPGVRRYASRVAWRRLRPGSERNAANGRLLEALLHCGDLPDAEAVDYVLDVALDWLEVQPSDHGGVRPLLMQVAHWLEHSPGRPQAEHRLRRALHRADAWLRDRPNESTERRQQVEGHRHRLAALLGTDDSY